MLRTQGSRLLITVLWLSVAGAGGCAFQDRGGGGPDQTGSPRDVAGETGTPDVAEVPGNDAPVARPVGSPEGGNWNPDADLAPQHVHITFRHDPSNTVTLQWETPRKDPATYVPRVWVVKASEVPGADPARFDDDPAIPVDPAWVHEGVGAPYCQTWACDEDTMEGLIWTVDLTGLDPDTTYYYRVGTWTSLDPATGVFRRPNVSPAYHFRTGLPKGSRQPFRFLWGSDSQNWMDDVGEQLSFLRSNTARGMGFWLFGGDHTEVGIQEELWGWFEAMAPLLRHFPFISVRGNHDILPLVLFGSFAFPEMPSLDDDLKRGAWSFNYGNLHMAGIDSNGEYLVERQAAWLEQDLAAASQDPDIDWKIVAFHHPAYSSCNVHGSTDYIQRLIVPILDRYGVDLAFSGHDHNYERTKPLKGGEIRDAGDGTVYIVAGVFYSKKAYGNGKSDFTVVSYDGEIRNYVVIDVDGRTLSGTAYNGAHEVIDTFRLTR